MRKRDVVGKRIVDVRYERWYCSETGTHCDVRALVLEDGTRLVPFAYETAECPAATIRMVKPEKGVSLETTQQETRARALSVA